MTPNQNTDQQRMARRRVICPFSVLNRANFQKSAGTGRPPNGIVNFKSLIFKRIKNGLIFLLFAVF